MLVLPLAVLAWAPAATPAVAAPVTPLRIASFTLAPDGTFAPGDVLRVDARVRNGGGATILNGRLSLFLRRRPTTHPSGRPGATGRVPGVRAGTLVTASAQLRLPRSAQGRYRFIACVTSAGHARRCRVVRGGVTVR